MNPEIIVYLWNGQKGFKGGVDVNGRGERLLESRQLEDRSKRLLAMCAHELQRGQPQSVDWCCWSERLLRLAGRWRWATIGEHEA